MNRREFHKSLLTTGLGTLLTTTHFAMPEKEESRGGSLPLLHFDSQSYLLGDKRFHLISGEFHYFRVPKVDWRRRMQLFKQAGGNCLATYIPWILHEPQEGKFVFGGEDGVRDVEGFLKLAREEELYVIARPGPYQYSEIRYAGLPAWLCENYPQVLAQRLDGKPIDQASISYLHPLFLEKVARWFKQVTPLISRHTLPKGGSVALVQLDNELMGIHLWNGSADYNPVTMGFGQTGGRYPVFLRNRYGSIQELNASYATHFVDFESVRPVTPAETEKPAEVRCMKDYFDFYCAGIAEYASVLAQKLRLEEIDTPLVHNSGNPDMNAYYLEMVRRLGEGFLLGSDHYYNLGPDWPQNNPTPQYAINIFYSLEMLRLMGFPPTVMEMPSGSASEWPPITPQDAQACYLANLAFGMRGHNYYIFTGGPNPDGIGENSDMYDYGAPIGARNEVRPLYKVQKEFHQLIGEHAWLATAEREYDVHVGLDFEFGRAANYWKGTGGQLLNPTEAWKFQLRGLLTSTFSASFAPRLCRLDSIESVEAQNTPLVVCSSSSMAENQQTQLVRYLQKGGKLLLAPVLPVVDEKLQPCTVLRDFLGRPEVTEFSRTNRRVTVGKVQNIFVNGAIFTTLKLPPGAILLGEEEFTQSPVAWRLTTPGGGIVIFLGFRWMHAKVEHAAMLAELLELLGANRKVHCSNPAVWTALHTSGQKSLLFVLNLYSSPNSVHLQCRPSHSRQMIDLGIRELAPMTVECIDVGS